MEQRGGRESGLYLYVYLVATVPNLLLGFQLQG